jgi:hypothetical protein
VILWSWTRHPHYRVLYAKAMTEPENAHLRFVRLCHPREADALLARVRDRGSSDQIAR